ncbi:ERCC4 domain-containing protein [Tsukamurella soli]
MDLVIATNPDPDSSLKYLMWVPLGAGRVYRTSDTWPRTKALYCHPTTVDEWPDDPDVVERIPLKACTGRGAAIDVIADRRRESRSQIVHTRARGRQMVFWQAPRTRKQARPAVTTPTARASGLPDLEIVIDVHERYAYQFTKQQADTAKRPLKVGDYAVFDGDAVVAAVERKSLADLTSSLTSGKLRYAAAELATVPRAAIVVEDRYSQVFKQAFVRPAVLADGIAELQVQFPTVPIVFCETRKLAEEWTYRFLGAACAASRLEASAEESGAPVPEMGAAAAPRVPPREPTTADLRAWARANGHAVSDKGRIPATVRAAYLEARRT